MTTIRKLAELADVSTATVMRVLHNNPHVAPETREKVLALASLYTYHPRVRQAAPEETNLIGCIIPRITSMTFSFLLQGVMETAFTESFRVIVLETKNQVAHTCRALDVLEEHRVQGIILAPGHVDLVPLAYLYRLWSQGIHMVVADDMPFDGAPQVDFVKNDNDDIGRKSVRYLYELGHRAIAVVGPMARMTDSQPTREAESYTRALREFHLPTKWMLDSLRMNSEEILDVLLAQPHPPTAIIAAQDFIAAQLINGLSVRGWPVPARMSVLGRGNQTYAEITRPRISSVEGGMPAMGARAAELLFARIASGEKPALYPKQRIDIPTELVIRESCGHPRQ